MTMIHPDPRPVEDAAAEAVLAALDAAALQRWESGETAARFAAPRH